MSLTADQQAALEQLWAVTASDSSASRERDERLLRENGWDVRRTIEQIFSMSEQPSATSSSSAGPSRPPLERRSVDEDVFSTHPPAGQRRLSGSRRTPRGATGTGGAGLGPFSLVASAFSMLWSIVEGTWFFFIRTFIPISFLPRLPRFLLPPSGTGPAPRARRDPVTVSLDWVRDLESFTGCSARSGTMPDFHIGAYREFLTNVRKEGRVGLVMLVCGEHEDDEEFKRDVLCDPELVKCLKEKEIMVWGADIRSREGYQVSQTLLTTTYPSLTFVSLLPVAGSSPKLSILANIQGPPSTITSSSSLIQTITNSILPRTAQYLGRLKRERLAIEETRHLREEQDRAFKDAERRDRERVLTRRQKEEAERIMLEREEREIREKEERVEKRRSWRRYARKHLLPPPQGPIRVVLRTPFSSERSVRQFELSESTLPLFIYAETLLISPSDDPATDPDIAPSGFEPEWDFRIVTTYPRKEIELVEERGRGQWDIVKGAGGALFAEKLGTGTWGEAESTALRDDSDEEIEE